tara:strand:+ start:42 stop:527 length:486 start_codon:yes stop_codon:yes gene_type:complete
MNYDDFLEFSDGKLVARGAYNIWVFNPEDDFGHKLFFSKLYSPKNFLNQNGGVVEPMSDTDLDRMFTLLTSMHEIGCYPQPISFFNYKSIKGIKIEKAEPATKELYDNRHKDFNFEGLKNIIPDSVYYIANTIQRHNYGQIDGKLVIVDVDNATLKNALLT